MHFEISNVLGNMSVVPKTKKKKKKRSSTVNTCSLTLVFPFPLTHLTRTTSHALSNGERRFKRYLINYKGMNG